MHCYPNPGHTCKQAPVKTTNEINTLFGEKHCLAHSFSSRDTAYLLAIQSVRVFSNKTFFDKFLVFYFTILKWYRKWTNITFLFTTKLPPVIIEKRRKRTNKKSDLSSSTFIYIVNSVSVSFQLQQPKGSLTWPWDEPTIDDVNAKLDVYYCI